MISLAAFRSLAQRLDPSVRRLRSEIHHISKVVPPSTRILDLGSGKAPYSTVFEHRHYITADLFAQADVRCDATTLPFASGVFDLILCTEVLEHVPDPDATLAEARRLLSGNGSLVLTTPLTWGVHEDRDFHRWTDSGLRSLLTKHGFKVVEVRPRGGILICLAALLLVIPWQLFGPARERSAWRSVLFATLYGLIVPFALVLGALDPLDRRQHFTHGYVVLCKR